MRRIFIICSFMLLVLVLFSQQVRNAAASFFEPTGLSDPPQKSAETAKIETYRRQIDLYKKQHPKSKRTFAGEIGDSGQLGPWKVGKEPEQQDMEQAMMYASVWTKEGRVVAATLYHQAEHSNESISYLFRDDGTLAYREMEGYSIGLDPPFSVITEFYSPGGKLLSRTTKCSASSPGRRLPCKEPTAEELVKGYSDKLYKKNTDLPFYNLLGKNR